MVFTTTDNVEIYFELNGNARAPALLLLHDLGYDHQMWAEQIVPYKASGYQVLVPDLRSHGKSSQVTRLSLRDWTIDINQLLNYVELEEVSIIGIGMGGVIALAFAGEFAERSSDIIICDTIPFDQTFGEHFSDYIRLMGFRLLEHFGREVYSYLLQKKYSRIQNEKVREYAVSCPLSTNPEQLSLAAAAIYNRQNLVANDIPVLVMAGELSSRFIKNAGRRFGYQLNRSDNKIVPRAMRPSNLTNPRAFDDIVLSYLSRTALPH